MFKGKLIQGLVFFVSFPGIRTSGAALVESQLEHISFFSPFCFHPLLTVVLWEKKQNPKYFHPHWDNKSALCGVVNRFGITAGPKRHQSAIKSESRSARSSKKRR